MKESVFSKVFAYRQRENHSPLENFLTEIFAFCIEEDIKFRVDFFKLVISNYKEQDITISTQESYDNYGRPDIEINFEDTCIIIECKVEASERFNQLNDYADILVKRKKQAKKIVVFITKYFESKELLIDNVELKLLRWNEIYKIINENNDSITKQLKIFLQEQDMDNVKNFSIQDILTMKTIPETLSKMDELLEQFKPIFEKHFGSFARENDPRKYYYDRYATFKYKSNPYYLAVGFWWSETEIPQFGLWFNIPKKKFENTDLITILTKELVDNNEWLLDDEELATYLMLMRPISAFMDKNEDCIPAMKKYVEQNLIPIFDIKDKYPLLLR